MKRFVLGFIIGAVLFSVLPIKAAIEEFICYKADYRVIINGEEYTHPDLPILNYQGNTYVPFRSALEQAGLIIDWDTQSREARVTLPEGGDYTLDKSILPDATQDGMTGITYNDKFYVDVDSLMEKYNINNGSDLILALDGHTYVYTLTNNATGKNVSLTPKNFNEGIRSNEVRYYLKYELVEPVLEKTDIAKEDGGIEHVSEDIIAETPDGITRIHYFDNEPYIVYRIIIMEYEKYGYVMKILVNGKDSLYDEDIAENITYQILKNNEVVVEFTNKDGIKASTSNIAIPYDFYVNNVMPFLKKE
jgi:hypothetical protein